MILDKLENASCYFGIHPGIDAILKEAMTVRAEAFPEERRYLDGDRVFMNFADYQTKPVSEAKFEAHRKYIDVMCMIEGEETIYVMPSDELKDITMEYREEKDCFLATFEEKNTPVLLSAGSFCILFPQDAHAPGHDGPSGSGRVKKIIGKVQK